MNIQKIICLAVELKMFSSASGADNNIRRHLLSLPLYLFSSRAPRAEAYPFYAARFNAR
jgi:hypothetical protein